MPQMHSDLDPSRMAWPSFSDRGAMQPSPYRPVVVSDRANAHPVDDPRMAAGRKDQPHVLGALVEAIAMDSDLEDVRARPGRQLDPDRASCVVVSTDRGA
jgi:hypothetical protein